jgi:hypothetical protein
MLITPERGKGIFGVLMVLVALGMIAAGVRDFYRAKARTSVTEVHVLKSFQTESGIGPLRHSSINVRYEFFANGLRFEGAQLVDDLTKGVTFVQFDPQQPQNSSLTLQDSTPQFLAVIAGLLFVIGMWLVLSVWNPVSRLSLIQKKI